MKDLFNCSLSSATIYNIVQESSTNLIEAELEIKEQLRKSSVLHADETGMRVATKQHYVHVAATERWTHYHSHPRRGAWAINEVGILPRFYGTCVHDGWQAYTQYRKADHALCNAHILRELNFFIEEEAQQRLWAQAMKDLLLEIKETVERAVSEGRKRIEREKVLAYESRYDELIREGLQANAASLELENSIPVDDAAEAKAAAKRTPALNLILRLRSRKAEVLKFMHDLRVPFTNNLAERDLRMIRLQQKVGGCFRSTDGARAFCRVRSIISTLRKQGREVIASLEKSFSAADLTLLWSG